MRSTFSLFLIAFLLVPSFLFSQEEVTLISPTTVGLALSDRGFLGVRRVASAVILPRSTFGVQANGDFWQMGDFLRNDTLQRRLENRGVFSLSLANFWEIAIVGETSSHFYRDLLTEDVILSQAIGDFSLGTKFAFPANPYFWLGLDFTGKFRTPRGTIGVKGNAGSISTNLLFTLDFTTLRDPTPLRISLNTGYFRDYGENLFPDEIQPLDRFILGIPWQNQAILGGISVEVPQRVVNLYLEYSTEQYIGKPKDPRLEKRTYISNPQRFTPGFRLFPTRGMVVDLSSDLGHNLFFSSARYDVEGLGKKEKIEPDWTAHLAVGYIFLPPAPELPKMGKVEGVIYDERTRQPIGGVVISFPQNPELSAILTNQKGEYRTYEFPLNQPVTLRIEKEQYQREETTITLTQPKITRDFYLKFVEKEGVVKGQTIDPTGKPVPATIKIVGTTLPPITVNPMTGRYESRLEEGTYTLAAEAEGYEPKAYRLSVVAGKTIEVNFVLNPAQNYGILKGSVRDEKGMPVANAVIRLDKPVLPPFGVYPQTGTFETALPPGSYTLSASAPGYKEEVRTIAVEKNSTVVLDLVLKQVTLTGKIVGKVVSEKTNKGVPAVISFPNGERENIPADPETGSFVIELPVGTYTIKAGHPEHQSQTQEVRVEAGKETFVTFTLKPFEKIRITKEKIEIKEQIQFKTGKATILPPSYSILNEIARVLKENPEIKLIIEGHTDNVGNPQKNKILSQKRADAVREYLLSQGISQDRLTAIGYGQERPIADNRTEEGRRLNRRVEFKIVQP
jgi:outer membrane protein OmpA-like peptidoglycan-associated protein